MIRLVKRYESRKLYDTEESRYVSLHEIASFVRAGQQVRVVESATEEDVTAPTLAQVILEEGRSGTRSWSPEVLHDLLRRGERALHSTFNSGAEQVQQGVDHLLRSSIGRLQPVRQAREEIERLRQRLDQLEGALVRMERDGDRPAAPGPAASPTAEPDPPAARRRPSAGKRAARRAPPVSAPRESAPPRQGGGRAMAESGAGPADRPPSTRRKTTRTAKRSSGGDE